MRVLVLGGTAEANALAALLAARPDIDATLSLAGRTAAPRHAPIAMRIGGFGGAEGLARHLREENIDVLADATHPFAEQISRNAVLAAKAAGRPLVVLRRRPWTRRAGDCWLIARDMGEAAQLLGAAPRRVFLAIGRQQLAAFESAPQHRYLIRGIEPVAPDLPDYRFLSARGPFEADAEEALLHAENIEIVVAKNSGSPAVYGKIVAARRLGLPVVMVERALVEAGAAAADPAEALDMILRHDARRAPRGV